MIGQLPRTITVGGEEYAIRSDYRDILNIISAINDPNLENAEKVFVCLYIFYEDFENMPERDYEEAYTKANDFISADSKQSAGKHPRVMDWEQDEQIIFPAINKVAGFEVREKEYIHWWTFLGYFMEISDGVFSNVMSLRAKKAKGKKLEKWEQEYWRENQDLCKLQEKLSDEEIEHRARLNALLG